METAPQIRIGLFKQIHEIVFHGKGGYDYNTLYHMPTWLRKFTFHELKKFYDAEAEATKSASKKSNQTHMVNPDGTVNVPAFKQASKPYERKSSYK